MELPSKLQNCEMFDMHANNLSPIVAQNTRYDNLPRKLTSSTSNNSSPITRMTQYLHQSAPFSQHKSHQMVSEIAPNISGHMFQSDLMVDSEKTLNSNQKMVQGCIVEQESPLEGEFVDGESETRPKNSIRDGHHTHQEVL